MMETKGRSAGYPDAVMTAILRESDTQDLQRAI
jgi:hypothetical protein